MTDNFDVPPPDMSRVMLAVLTAVAITVAGCLTPHERSRRALQQGDYDAARDYANQALDASDAQDPRAYLLLAEAYIAEEKYEKAKPFAKKGFQSQETSGEAGRLLGKIYWETGKPVEAALTWGDARDVDTGVVSDEDYRKALVAGIEESRRTQSYSPALELQRRLRKLDPDHELASEEELQTTRKNFADQLVESNELKRAASMYEKLANETGEAQFWFELGSLRLQLDKTQAARAAFNRFVRSDDNSVKAERTSRVGQLAANNGHADLAVDFLLRSHELRTSPTFERAKIEQLLAEQLFILGRHDTARQYLETYLETQRAIRGRPLSADAYLTAVDTANEHNESAFAADLLEKALTTAPPDWTVAARLAQHYAVQIRDEEVRRVLETFVDRSSDTVDSLTRCARWARDRQNYALAREFLRRAIDKSDSAPELRMELARTLDRQGDIEQLKEVLDAFTERFPDRRHSLLEVASLYAKHNLYADAESVLNTLRDRSPESLVIVDRIAALYREWGKTDRIEPAYRRWLQARGGSAADYRLVGERFSRHGADKLALEFLRQAAKRGETEAWLKLADLYKSQQRDKQMRQALEAYLSAKDRSPNALRAVLNRLDSTSLDSFTVEVLRELIDRQPSERQYYQQLAQVRLSQGNRAAAFEVWRKYVDRAGRSVEVLQQIGEWFQANGNAELALPFYRQWLDEIDDPRLYRLLGKAYLATGRRDTLQRVMNPDTSGQNKSYARRYFEKYLTEGNFEGIELLEFAGVLRDNAMWQPAARAYGRALRDTAAGDAAQLEYALTLLKLGHAGEAIKVQKAYFDKRGKSTEAAVRIADQLTDANLYRSALPYLDKLMNSDVPNLRRKAFVRTLESFVQLGRHNDIDPLLETYIDRASNPAKARQLAIQTLARRGLLDRAVEQIERTRELQGDVMGLKLGSYYLRTGEAESAWEQFDDYATNHSFGTEAWLEIAETYRSRAMPKEARLAYDRAVETSSDGFKAHMHRGLFSLYRGHFEAAMSDYETAVDRAAGNVSYELHKQFVSALRDVGRFGKAREITTKVRTSATAQQTFFAQKFFSDALKLATRERSRRLIDELTRSPLDLRTTVELLDEHGFVDKAVELIDREFENGNLATAGRAVAAHASTITTVGGRDLLARLARPLLRSSSLESPVRARLGAYMIRQGDYRRGIRYLSEAQSGRPIFWPMLVQAHANLGHVTRAVDLVRDFQTRGTGIPIGPGVWEQAAVRFGLSGHHEAFVEQLGLSHLGPEAPPTLVRLQIEQQLAEGRPTVAVEQLRRISGANTPQPRVAGPDVQRRVSQLTAGLSALAERGYVQETGTLIDLVDGDIREHPTFREFQIRFDARFRPGQLGASLDADLETPVDVETVLDRIDLLMLSRRFDRAEKLLDRLPDKITPGFGARAAEHRRLLKHLGGVDTRRNSDGGPTFAAAENPLGSRLGAYRTARHLGWDGDAYEHLREAFDQAPTRSRASRLFAAAKATGDEDAMRDALDLYFRHADGPLDQLTGDLMRSARRLDPAVVKPMLDRVATVRSGSLALMFARTLVDVRTGNIEEARDRLTGYLERVDFDPIAIHQVVQFLNREKLHTEVRHIVDLALRRGEKPEPPSSASEDSDDPTLVPRETLMQGALAAASLGFGAQSREWSDRALVGAPAKATRAQRAATTACRRQLARACRSLAERATDLAPERPPGWFALGVAEILDGDTDSGASHVERGLRGGIDRYYGLETAARAALRSDAPQLANQYLEALVRTPNPAQISTLEPLQRTISTYNRASASDIGVQMIESKYPTLATARGPAGRRAARVLTSLYQGAGKHQKAYDMHHASLDDTWLDTELSDGATAVLLNNLAYAYATGGHHLDRAETLVGLALGFSRRRTSSYLDTRGWIAYKQGRFAQAERDVRSAIRTADNNTALHELYSHLSAIRGARGDSAAAYWLDRFASTFQ